MCKKHFPPPTYLTMGFDVISVVALDVAQGTLLGILDKLFLFVCFNTSYGPG